MTTFTKVLDSEKPLIEVDAEKKLSKIDPMTYGGFTEYVQSPPCTDPLLLDVGRGRNDMHLLSHFVFSDIALSEGDENEERLLSMSTSSSTRSSISSTDMCA